jgi:hypothetical protein
MTRRVYFYFVATFLLGAVLGGAGVFYYGWTSGHWHRGFDRNRAVTRLKNNLGLDDNQVQQVQQILDDGFHRMRELQKQSEPQFQALREDTRNRIRAILNSEQVKKFDALVKEMDERRHRMGPPPPP